MSKSLEVLYGIDLESFNAVTGGFRYVAGGPFQGPYDMLIDDLKAGSDHIKVGDTVQALITASASAASWSTARERVSSSLSPRYRT